MQIPEWFKWEREGAVYPICLWQSLTLRMRAFYGKGWPTTYLFFNNGIVLWANSIQGLCDLGQFLIDKLLQKDEFERMEKQLGKDAKHLASHFSRITPENLSSLSDSELLKLERSFWNATADFCVTGLAVEPVYLQGEILLREMLKDSALPEPKLSLLSSCSRKSFSLREECELLQIAIGENLTGENLQDALSNNARLKKKLNFHSEKYFWLQNGYLRTKILSPEYFADELAFLLKEKNPATYLNELELSLQNRQKEKESLMDSLKLNEKQCNFVNLIDYFAWFQDYRKEMILQAVHYADTLLAEFAKRGNYSLEEMKFVLPLEIPLSLQKKLSRKNLQERMKRCAIIWDEDSEKAQLLTGDDALSLERKLFPNTSFPTKEIIEFSGTTANPGKIQGIARVTMNPEEANRLLKKGEILVTSMTSPDFVPALKRASAVVTNEGGITCHAAIVSREFGIPCIVGTRIATKVIKSGDFIEVDGNHGMVRKLVK